MVFLMCTIKLLRVTCLVTFLVEQFNQIQKRMLHWVVDEEGQDWDLLLPYVLITI